MMRCKMMMGFTVMLGMIQMGMLAYAQDSAPVAESPWQAVMDMALKSLVPALWIALGPILVAGLTKVTNKYVNAYVPRPLQVILSALIGAIGAGLTGDTSSAVVGLAGGATAQVYAAAQPSSLLTEAKQ